VQRAVSIWHHHTLYLFLNTPIEFKSRVNDPIRIKDLAAGLNKHVGVKSFIVILVVLVFVWLYG